MIVRENGFVFTMDAMVADDGHNGLLLRFCYPSNPIFEESLANEFLWVFPPLDLISLTLKFLVNAKREGIPFKCCILVQNNLQLRGLGV